MAGNVEEFLDARLRTRKPPAGDFNHWRMERNQANILWLYLDRKDARTNTLNAEVLTEFDTLLDSLKDNLPKALVIRSLKSGGFCAGADINQFSSLDADQISELLSHGHRTLDRLESLPFPTIAILHGHCLGGGLELALACRFRIGVEGGLEMGFPEILLGLHPGLGGTFRSLELIDPLTAMTMMLTGKSAHDRQALSHGLVDSMVRERHLEAAVQAIVDGHIKRKRRSLRNRFINMAPVRKLIAPRMQSRAAGKAAPHHYPAPKALIDLWLAHGGDRKAMQAAEQESFIRLFATTTSRNLVRVYFLREGLKQAARGESNIRHVHVIGAGAMGGDIAAWCAMQGCRVTLSDVKLEPLAAAVRSVTSLCQSRHKSSLETRNTLDRLMPDPAGEGVRKADLIIEAVPENIELKQKIYQQAEPLMKKNAILATNTSSIPLHKLADFLSDPARLVGVHFFNPVAKMQIVEVVSHDRIAAQVRERALAFTTGIGKLPVAVQSYPGFAVNRALTPYLLEAMVLLDEGVTKEVIDRAARDFGMPMGPVELADQVGLDICLNVAAMLSDHLDRPMARIPDWLHKKVQKGELGRKSGQGFYTWNQGKPKPDKQSAADARLDYDELTDRLILPMLNACVECLREKVIADADQLDAAMIFGTGFAPFRGGPIHYASARGVDRIVEKLEFLAQKHGERFTPDAGWQSLTGAGERANAEGQDT